MPQVDTPGMQLRIYCICGQKMKVSSSMFGRPGKCIACRQKIRIPRKDEIPPDVATIYLKDFPQFLRKPAVAAPKFSEVDRASAAALEADTGDEAEDVSLGDAAPDGPATPLDALPPLQVLCSLEEKVQRQLERLKKAPTQGSSAEKATLVRYRTLIRNARSAFDDRLRDRLVETTEQLSGVKETIARASMSMRVGETHYEAYLEKVRPLRMQRDRLERRLQNLRGWLVTSDPMIAGGYVDLRLEDVPVEAEDVTFPLEARPTAPLLDQHVEGLRAAMQERAGAERRLAEWQRIERERALPPNEIESGRRESEAVRARATAGVAFARACLEQAVQDCEQDNKAIRSYLDHERGRIHAGEIDANAYKVIETRLLHAQNDNVNAREFARRALAANSPGDIPRPSSTLLERLAVRTKPDGLGVDSWIAWAASALMGACIVVPIARHQAQGNLVAASPLSLGLFLAAGALALLALLPKRRLRAAALNVAWTTITISVAAYLHEAWFGTTALGVALRNDPNWFTSPGILLITLACMVTGLAAAVSVVSVRELRRAPGIASGVIFITLCLLFTDVFGVLTARPELREPTFQASTTRAGEYDVQIDLSNTGWRALQLGGDQRLAASPATFLLRRNIGPDSWEDVTTTQLVADKVKGQLGGRAASFPALELQGGDALHLSYHLRPGTYQAEVLMPTREQDAKQRKFTLVELESTLVPTAPAPQASAAPVPPAPRAATKQLGPAKPAAVPAPAPAPANVPAAAASPAPAPAAPVVSANVVLQGIINAAGRDPRFIVNVTIPGSDMQRRYLALGDVVVGEWKAAEFNPDPQRLTLNNGKQLLVLERGASVNLGPAGPVAVSAAPPAPAPQPIAVPEAPAESTQAPLDAAPGDAGDLPAEEVPAQ